MSLTNLSIASSGGGAASDDYELQLLCDTVGPFLRRYNVTAAGVVTIVNTTLDGTTAYAPVGVVSKCEPVDNEIEVLCDTVTSFLRRYSVSPLGVVTITNTALDATTAYAPVGAVVKCSQRAGVFGAAQGAGAVVLAPPATSYAVTVTAQSGTFDVSFDAGVTFALTGRQGTRTWGVTDRVPTNAANLRFRGVVGSVFDIIWERY